MNTPFIMAISLIFAILLGGIAVTVRAIYQNWKEQSTKGSLKTDELDALNAAMISKKYNHVRDMAGKFGAYTNKILLIKSESGHFVVREFKDEEELAEAIHT